eukprot:Platyproteum_vivax@DN7416_c0_g2_i1.p1
MSFSPESLNYRHSDCAYPSTIGSIFLTATDSFFNPLAPEKAIAWFMTTKPKILAGQSFYKSKMLSSMALAAIGGEAFFTLTFLYNLIWCGNDYQTTYFTELFYNTKLHEKLGELVPAPVWVGLFWSAFPGVLLGLFCQAMAPLFMGLCVYWLSKACYEYATTRHISSYRKRTVYTAASLLIPFYIPELILIIVAGPHTLI